VYRGGENVETAQRLAAGESCVIVGVGNSMTPVLKSGQPVIMEPVTANTVLEKGDIVLAKVHGCYYCHKISAVRPGDRYQISNNHGHVNGWVARKAVFGKVTKIL
jgi:hypothetical protein